MAYGMKNGISTFSVQPGWGCLSYILTQTLTHSQSYTAPRTRGEI